MRRTKTNVATRPSPINANDYQASSNTDDASSVRPPVVTPDGQENVAFSSSFAHCGAAVVPVKSQKTGATKHTWRYFLEKVRQKIRAEYPGASFGQQSKLASAFYQEIPEAKMAWFKQELLAGNLPELRDLYPSEDAKKRKSKLFEGLEYLFALNGGSYQRQWWSGETLVNTINQLTQAPFNGIFNPAREPFEPKELQKALAAGLGSKDLVGGDSADFGESATYKTHFLLKFKSREGLQYYLYVDESLAETPKVVRELDILATDKVRAKQMNQMEFLPLDLIDLSNYWHSTECQKTFVPIEGETTKEAAEKQMHLLRDAANDKREMKKLIDGLDGDTALSRDLLLGEIDEKEDTWVRLPVQISQADIDDLVADYQQLCLYISLALQLVLEEDGMSLVIHWKKKCGAAVKKLKAIGVTYYTGEGGESVMNWFAVFRKFRSFPNLLLESKRYGPPILLDHPRLVIRAIAFANEHLDNLSAQQMHEHFHNVLLPELIEEKQAAMNDRPNAEEIAREITIDALLKEYRIKRLCSRTINNWMHFMGLHRERYKKGCFTDVHNKPENVEANLLYCIDILTKYEFRSACWVQLKVERVKELQNEGQINESYEGYRYDSNCMAEFHVDDIKDACDLPELESNELGGLLSVRKEELFPGTRELLLFGHDEAVAHENAQNSFTWLGRNGEQPLRPKDLGTALHMSAYTNRQVGWHPKPTTLQLDEINGNRRGTNYLAEELAIKLYGTAVKHPLEAMDESFCWWVCLMSSSISRI
jgi:hypothetical protein